MDERNGFMTVKTHLPPLSVFLVVLGIAFLGSNSPASANFNVCNPTQEPVAVAIGYSDGNGWVSEGWWAIAPQDCAAILQGELTAQYYYVRAQNGTNTISWGGPATLCVLREAFVIKGRTKCAQRGYQETGFRQVDTGEAKQWDLLLEVPLIK